MNRPAVGSQSLRGLPNGFPSQPQIPQNRSVSSRLPPGGKMAGNTSSWAFGGGVTMGSGGLGNPRSNNGPMTSFAQTIGGSAQSAAPLDLSSVFPEIFGPDLRPSSLHEFPSLSNNPSQPSQSTWAASGSRNPGPANNLRLQQPSSLSAQQQLNAQQQSQQQQEDLFSSSSQLSSSQGGFRFGNQNAVGQTSQQSSTVDEFPPLNRNANGEIGQDRGSSLMQGVGFGSQSNTLGFGSSNPPQPNRSNGLLNALSGSSRAPGNRGASPTSIAGVSISRSPVDTSHQSLSGVSETDPSSYSSAQFASALPHREDSNPLSPMLRDAATQQGEGSTTRPGISSQNTPEEDGPEIHDPLVRMSQIDKYGLKGFTILMNNFPDYAGLVTGSDVTNLGFDLNSGEQFSNQIYSLFDNEPSRPPVPQYTLPECYRVLNIAQLDTKMSNFNDEALIFMFYSNPGGLHQVMAAQELHQRNWRYHKKLQLWLTKDDMMQPQPLGNGSERGYYIFFDIKNWSRERRDLTLVYDDLEQVPPTSRTS